MKAFIAIFCFSLAVFKATASPRGLRGLDLSDDLIRIETLKEVLFNGIDDSEEERDVEKRSAQVSSASTGGVSAASVGGVSAASVGGVSAASVAGVNSNSAGATTTVAAATVLNGGNNNNVNPLNRMADGANAMNGLNRVYTRPPTTTEAPSVENCGNSTTNATSCEDGSGSGNGSAEDDSAQQQRQRGRGRKGRSILMRKLLSIDFDETESEEAERDYYDWLNEPTTKEEFEMWKRRFGLDPNEHEDYEKMIDLLEKTADRFEL